jgi:hypothetical protein
MYIVHYNNKFTNSSLDLTMLQKLRSFCVFLSASNGKEKKLITILAPFKDSRNFKFCPFVSVSLFSAKMLILVIILKGQYCSVRWFFSSIYPMYVA